MASIPRRGRPYSPHDTSEVNLGVKWGLETYGRIMEQRSGGRITRTAAQAILRGETPVATPVATYRGHRGVCVKVSAPTDSAPAHKDSANGADVPDIVLRARADTSAEGGSDGLAGHRDGSISERRDGSPHEHRDGSLQRMERREGSPDIEGDSFMTTDAGLTKDTLLKRLERGREETRSEDSEDEVSEALGVGEWKLATRTSTEPSPAEQPVITITKFVPSWFDLCDVDDQLGPLPYDWRPEGAREIPRLPDVEGIRVDSSFMEEFWREVAAQQVIGEAEALRRAVLASQVTAAAERRELRQQVPGLKFNAVIVEIEEEETTEIPTGQDGRFTANQK
ncbi:hypothetical protein BD309DRAFT_1023898 [Dichomitus squalens]|nr:hypothetical protein BD309DRAFT_1023898 [Dichomitus squalens]